MDTNDISKEEAVRLVERTRAEAKRAVKNAGEVWSGKNSVASAWRSTKGTYLRVHDKVSDHAYATDKTIRENVYPAVGIALALGGIIGFFATNRPHRSAKKRKC